MTTDEMAYQDAMLLIAADALGDMEATRIASGNRLASLIGVKGISAGPEVTQARVFHEALVDLERQMTLALQRSLRRHYLGPWVRAQVGVGEKQGARLVASIGNPRWNHLEDRPRRGPAELWAYCGYHVIDGQRPRRRRGEKANWNGKAKSCAWLIATSCIKQAHSPYRAVYDAARAKAATKVHEHQCQNSKRPPMASNGCGTREHPEWGAPGSPWRAGHQHQYALTIVAKEILKDMFVATPLPDTEETLMAA